MIRMFLEGRYDELQYVASNKEAYDKNTYITYQIIEIWTDVWTLAVL